MGITICKIKYIMNKITVEEFINLFTTKLEDFRKQSQLEGEFYQADLTKSKIEELKRLLFQRKSDKLCVKQLNERYKIEEKNMYDYKKLTE